MWCWTFCSIPYVNRPLIKYLNPHVSVHYPDRLYFSLLSVAKTGGAWICTLIMLTEMISYTINT